MKKKLIKLAKKILFRRKVKKMDKTLGDVIQLTKFSDLMKKSDNNEKIGKAIKIVLICTGIFAILVAAGFVVYKLMGRRTDDYDLYDDLDNYYDEADHYDVDLDAHEGDFVEE